MAEKEYIEREAAIAVIYGQHVGGKEACENARPNTYGADLREIVADIEDLPAADVRPVVLCRDCEYYFKDEDGYEMCDNSEGYDHVTADGFCAWGEKREES